MSKSRGNCIFLADDAKTVAKKVRSIFTDPNRVRADIPGQVEGNPLFAYQDAFNPDPAEVAELKERYAQGRIGDSDIKQRLTEILEELLGPIRQRIRDAEESRGLTDRIIAEGTERARSLACETLREMRSAMGLASAFNRIRRGAEKAGGGGA